MFVSRPAAVHHILAKNPDNYVRPHAAKRVLAPPIGEGLFLAEGEEWRRQRCLLAPAFSPRAVPGLTSQVVRLVKPMLERLQAGPLDRMPLFEILRDLTVEIAAAAFFGMKIAPYVHALQTMSNRYKSGLCRGDLFDLVFPAWLPPPRDFARRRFRRRWLALIALITADHRDGGSRTDLFEELDESETSRGLFVQQIATLLITGSETTGSALFWSVYLAATTPDLQARIAAEAEAAEPTETNANDALERLPVTRALLNEAMRLYPPAFSIVRQALTDDVADGVEIRKGAIVQTAPWIIHRHRLLWERPDTFDADRFLPHAVPPQRFSYIPFGVGPRQCIGMQFALAEATLVLAMLFREFAIAPTVQRPVTPTAHITLQPNDPAAFRIEARRR
jgi:cytochrome P450